MKADDNQVTTIDLLKPEPKAHWTLRVLSFIYMTCMVVAGDALFIGVGLGLAVYLETGFLILSLAVCLFGILIAKIRSLVANLYMDRATDNQNQMMQALVSAIGSMKGSHVVITSGNQQDPLKASYKPFTPPTPKIEPFDQEKQDRPEDN